VIEALWIGLALVVAGAGALALAAAAIVVDGLRDRPGVADVAVVLGCRVYASGEPSPKLQSRLERALAVYGDGLAPVIIVSGDAKAKEGFDEAAVMKAWLVGHGVPDEDVLTDGAGVDTRATAVNAAAWMRDNEATSVIAVSQYFHIPRIRLAFRQAGVRAVRTAHADGFTWGNLSNIAREVAAYGKYLLTA
jgi:vancomycin permeability regulator SanA